ncbi:hypothetical protein HKD42_11600 [Altererythrobacter sp. RZ02]|uniref:Pentapeptide repeat-containing protein n=1 Tax=Pontixanthobacter rizhaonensis TaxID=2730337 RepID=A0A848QP84_9SPHN|nr:hypothetical protein [Pontixanthobacter rizhaonensis]NMW32709.1 hypothetical protein [Pontixanthobacter rizhaonensis]
MSDKKPTRKVLKGEDAIELWRRGREVWNAWVEQNPEADVNFSSQSFNGPNNLPLRSVDFTGFIFPNGFINFADAKLGDGNVWFVDAEFGRGNVNFYRTKFGKGNVSFSDAKFGSGDINFANAKFGDGHINFSNTEFNTGTVDFSYVEFSSGDVSFHGTNFGEGNTYFIGATFDRGDIRFYESSFGKGQLMFDNTDFGSGAMLFEKTEFKSNCVTFRYCNFAGPSHFVDLQRMDCPRTFSFEGAGFEKLFTFSHFGIMGCPLDLRRTKMSHDVVVNDIQCQFDAEPMPNWASAASQYWSGMPERSAPVWRWTTKASDREDSQRFRRLKELALSNRNHAKALEFHVQEIQSKRGHETRWWQTAAQFLFWLLGDYGRSVFRPFIWLIATWVGFAAYFFAYSTEQSAKFSAALAYSGSHMLAFIPTGRTARLQGQEWLFGEDTLVPASALGVGAAESILSVILLFLLGLGLRNLFRV